LIRSTRPPASLLLDPGAVALARGADQAPSLQSLHLELIDPCSALEIPHSRLQVLTVGLLETAGVNFDDHLNPLDETLGFFDGHPLRVFVERLCALQRLCPPYFLALHTVSLLPPWKSGFNSYLEEDLTGRVLGEGCMDEPSVQAIGRQLNDIGLTLVDMQSHEWEDDD
jgi:hypothetical protein